MSWDDTSERPSHGAPTFYIRDKNAFAMLHVDHHGDGRLAVWCAAPPGANTMLVDAEPEHYFIPPYVGPRGWIGIRLDCGIPRDEIVALLEQAYLFRSSKAKARAERAE